MKITRLSPRDYRIMPWKNGLGSTTELAIHPPGATLAAGDFLWRLSSADVAQDGPFSRFPECERHLGIVRGAGMVLTVDGVDIAVDGDRVACFSGSSETAGRLVHGPVRDLNLITKERALAGSLTFLRSEGASLCEDIKLLPGTAILFALEKQAAVQLPPPAEPLPVHEHEALLIETDSAVTATLHLPPGARLALAQITPKQ